MGYSTTIPKHVPPFLALIPPVQNASQTEVMNTSRYMQTSTSAATHFGGNSSAFSSIQTPVNAPSASVANQLLENLSLPVENYGFIAGTGSMFLQYAL